MFSAKIDASDLRKITDALGPDLARDIAQAVADEEQIPCLL